MLTIRNVGESIVTVRLPGLCPITVSAGEAYSFELPLKEEQARLLKALAPDLKLSLSDEAPKVGQSETVTPSELGSAVEASESDTVAVPPVEVKKAVAARRVIPRK